jgi:hypothetical protein
MCLEKRTSVLRRYVPTWVCCALISDVVQHRWLCWKQTRGCDVPCWRWKLHASVSVSGRLRASEIECSRPDDQYWTIHFTQCARSCSRLFCQCACLVCFIYLVLWLEEEEMDCNAIRTKTRKHVFTDYYSYFSWYTLISRCQYAN